MKENSFKLLPRPIFIVSRILGVFPIDMTTFEYSKLNLLYTICEFLLSMFQILFIFDIDDRLRSDSSFIFMVKMLSFYVISFASIGSKYTCSIVFKEHLESLFLEMKASDTFLRSAYKFSRDRTTLLLSFGALVTYTIFVVLMFFTRLTKMVSSKVKLKNFTFYACLFWQNLTVGCTELQFIFMVVNLYFQFCQINVALTDILIKIHKIKHSYSKSMLDSREYLATIDDASGKTEDAYLHRASEGKTQDSRRILSRHNFYTLGGAPRILRNGGISNHVYGTTNFAEEILNLRTAHVHLSEAIYLLNKIFGLQLLLSLNLCFCCFLININYELFGSFRGQSKKLPFSAMIRGVGLLIRFLAIILVSNCTCREAKYANTLISSMADRCLSKETREELTIFSTHLLSYDFEFNACGFFALDLGLVTSAVAAGTTYLVILLQFEPSDGLGNKNK